MHVKLFGIEHAVCYALILFVIEFVRGRISKKGGEEGTSVSQKE